MGLRGRGIEGGGRDIRGCVVGEVGDDVVAGLTCSTNSNVKAFPGHANGPTCKSPRE